MMGVPQFCAPVAAVMAPAGVIDVVIATAPTATATQAFVMAALMGSQDVELYRFSQRVRESPRREKTARYTDGFAGHCDAGCSGVAAQGREVVALGINRRADAVLGQSFASREAAGIASAASILSASFSGVLVGA
ncbi:hypothetical protein GCM10009745_47000 [Kribbella yunnanensis]|uniref:Uncharacterized protein n=1 Tax=Kribbella yunnanensis TaxID=190194 RepID=A0ABN2HYR2_9ACTN